MKHLKIHNWLTKKQSMLIGLSGITLVAILLNYFVFDPVVRKLGPYTIRKHHIQLQIKLQSILSNKTKANQFPKVTINQDAEKKALEQIIFGLSASEKLKTLGEALTPNEIEEESKSLNTLKRRLHLNSNQIDAVLNLFKSDSQGFEMLVVLPSLAVQNALNFYSDNPKVHSPQFSKALDHLAALKTNPEINNEEWLDFAESKGMTGNILAYDPKRGVALIGRTKDSTAPDDKQVIRNIKSSKDLRFFHTNKTTEDWLKKYSKSLKTGEILDAPIEEPLRFIILRKSAPLDKLKQVHIIQIMSLSKPSFKQWILSP